MSSSAEASGGNGSDLDGQPVPFPRFKEVNDKYGKLRWAEGFDSDRVNKALSLADWLDSNPRGFYDYFGSQLRANGILPAEEVKAAVRQAGGSKENIPGPDYRDPNTGATFYSAERMNEVFASLRQELGQQIQPLNQTLGMMQVQARARQDADTMLRQAASWPHFTEYKGQIRNAMASNPNLTLQDAYIAVVAPELSRAERTTVAAELQAKPGATTVNPGGMAPAAGEKPAASTAEALRREMKKRGMNVR